MSNRLLEDEESHMRGEGWKRSLTIKKIVEKPDGSITCQEWDFFHDTMPCRVRDGGTGPRCGADHVWIRMLNGKLFWCCTLHRICNGPIGFEGAGTMPNEYPVSAIEAVEIYRANGQRVPKSIAEKFRASRTKRTRRRRPTE